MQRKLKKATKSAIYVRSAEPNQGAIDARVSICEKYAANADLAPTRVFADIGLSGNTLDQRPALTAMLAAANSKPRPFDVVLVESCPQLGRSFVIVQSIVEQLTRAGVALIVVTPHLDSRDPNFRQQIAVSAMIGDLHISGHRHCVRRGQEGRVLSGMTPGGYCYGYRNVPVVGNGQDERPNTYGITREIIPTEAEVVQSIFKLYNSGATLADIAHRLNEAGVSSLSAQIGVPESRWSPSRILSILRNVIYRGVIIWGKTSRRHNPVSLKATAEKRQPGLWHRRLAPELRIVTDEQFHRAQKILRARKKGRA